MSPSIFAAFWAVSLLFVITPGADWAYAISAGLFGRVVIPAVAGLLIGHLLATVIVAAGVGGLIASNPLALSLLTLGGAGYLLWLGINMLRHPSVPRAGDAQASASWTRWTLKGACVSGLNPKVFLLFLALLPQFTDPLAAWPVPLQILALGLLHAVSCAVIYLLVGFGSRAVLRTRPVAAQAVSRLSGALMIIIAVLLLIEQVLR
ncbi:LysE family translocator [Pseudomonas chlororaphis]|uniref:LysE family translocator n=1 Tax=Pseudomonas chlororaphis TaxID=587753 RepID=UPI0007B3E5F9|nr:LysE family translocator [Pseudomonas chlororaphis]AZC50269.1 Transporter, LysE family [Pseudomonas chlororaphis subsp. piscium]AZC56851.1 Transporter, LysE family [Pseudomonas chlororaphis subsp. piscium]AZC63077.1 Transporter, LysE family [Pseudomonas chlororaphis subsp. piscium]AZC69308.1 Transporter, LysE family [Pseudomonas chlororaphis subsp. piscium]AZC75486.1 Transporter, LysE family [Pseudomonas chlororaphis subsp. piscium]